MKIRGLPSPDWGDALALTFAAPVSNADMQPRPAFAEAGWDPFGHAPTTGGRPARTEEYNPIREV